MLETIEKLLLFMNSLKTDQRAVFRQRGRVVEGAGFRLQSLGRRGFKAHACRSFCSLDSWKEAVPYAALARRVRQ